MAELITSIGSSWLSIFVSGLIYLVACFGSWYLLAVLSYGLNSGQLGRHPALFPFECFAEEIKCYWFGGQKYRIEFIKNRCYGEGWFCGFKRSYSHKEIRENNLYEEVFWAMLGGRISFWSEHIVSFFLGPALIALFLVMSFIGLVVSVLVYWPINKVRSFLVR